MPEINATATEGPWRSVDYGEGLLRNKGYIRAIVGPDEKIICTIDFDVTNCRGVRQDFTHFHDHYTGWANARLIESAPALLALAEAVIDSVSEDGEFNSRTAEISLQELRRMADTIVAKVAGDEP